jgi:hypothetical protein
MAGPLAGGGEFVATLLELRAQVRDSLFQVDDALFERVDVVGRAETGLAPGRGFRVESASPSSLSLPTTECTSPATAESTWCSSLRRTWSRSRPPSSCCLIRARSGGSVRQRLRSRGARRPPPNRRRYSWHSGGLVNKPHEDADAEPYKLVSRNQISFTSGCCRRVSEVSVEDGGPFDDFVGGGRPGERFGVVVPMGDVVNDGPDQVRDGGRGPAADGLAGGDAEPVSI